MNRTTGRPPRGGVAPPPLPSVGPAMPPTIGDPRGRPGGRRPRTAGAAPTINHPDPAERGDGDRLAFPAPGDVVAGFRIRSELGRGAFARVYLAEQADLANRLVALKVSQAVGDESQLLARLQHTHI